MLLALKMKGFDISLANFIVTNITEDENGDNSVEKFESLIDTTEITIVDTEEHIVKFTMCLRVGGGGVIRMCNFF